MRLLMPPSDVHWCATFPVGPQSRGKPIPPPIVVAELPGVGAGLCVFEGGVDAEILVEHVVVVLPGDEHVRVRVEGRRCRLADKVDGLVGGGAVGALALDDAIAGVVEDLVELVLGEFDRAERAAGEQHVLGSRVQARRAGCGGEGYVEFGARRWAAAAQVGAPVAAVAVRFRRAVARVCLRPAALGRETRVGRSFAVQDSRQRAAAVGKDSVARLWRPLGTPCHTTPCGSRGLWPVKHLVVGNLELLRFAVAEGAFDDHELAVDGGEGAFEVRALVEGVGVIAMDEDLRACLHGSAKFASRRDQLVRRAWW